MGNVKSRQRWPINSANKKVMTDSGSDCTFNCDSSNPFDYNTIIPGAYQRRAGMAVKFMEDLAGNPPVVASSITNGLLGRDLDGEWPAGAGFAVEIETLTMTSGIAEIILKKVIVKGE